MQLSLKFDLRAPAFGADPADLYAAALDMCAWADAAGSGFGSGPGDH